jgi:ABC-type multidrug transport system permease subunit
MIRRCALVLAFLLCAGALFAQVEADELYAARGEYLTLKVAVIGPGDELYIWWGHIGLVIEDALSGETRFYDWGVFNFEKENFFLNFAFGRLLYRCEVSYAENNFAWNIATNRDITLYTLDLPPEIKTEIFLKAENNVLPENRDYWYHHFRDNCSTRVRDIIDLATRGAYKEQFGEAPGRFTLREHVRRHTWFSPFWDWSLSFWMGQDIDRPITVWDEMFLPSEVGRTIADFRYIDSGGTERKLVSSVEFLNKASGRPGVSEQPPSMTSGIIAGILLAALFIFFKLQEARQKNLFRIFSCLSQSLLGLFFGITGFLLFFLSFFTNHDYTFHNSNVIFVNPLLFAAIPLGIICAFSKNAARRSRTDFLLKLLWTYVAIGGLLTIAIKLLPNFYQQNQVTQILFIPFACVLSFFPGWIKKIAGIRKR